MMKRAANGAIHRERASSRTLDVCVLPAWGYLDKIELLPHDDLPNMDASRPYRLFGELLAPDGRRIPVDVYAVCSNVE